MPTEVDYCEVLGVAPDADLAEVKLAFRRAALSYHPDSYDGDPAEAERKLLELIRAYKALARSRAPARPAAPPDADRPAYSPRDFAREGPRVFWRPPRMPGDPDLEAAGVRLAGRRYPTRNETRTFAVLWAGALVLGLAVGGVVAWRRSRLAGLDGPTTGDVLLSVLWGELVYAALAAAGVVLVLLSRKVYRLTLHLLGGRWRFLPAPRRRLPRPPADRELPHAAP